LAVYKAVYLVTLFKVFLPFAESGKSTAVNYISTEPSAETSSESGFQPISEAWAQGLPQVLSVNHRSMVGVQPLSNR
jgi:hypothetical protein